MGGRVGFEPSTIGLKDSHLIYQVFINRHLRCLSYFIVPENASKRWLITASRAHVGTTLN